jgi:hypothetical protein
MRNGAGQVVATHSKRRGESAVVESRAGLVERVNDRSNANWEGRISCTFTGGRVAGGTPASGRRLEVALPLCYRKPSPSTIPNKQAAGPSLRSHQSDRRGSSPAYRARKVGQNFRRSSGIRTTEASSMFQPATHRSSAANGSFGFAFASAITRPIDRLRSRPSFS